MEIKETARKIPKLRRYIIVLTALLDGRDIAQPDGRILHLFKPGESIRLNKNEYGESDNYFLANKLICQSGGEEFDIYMGSELGFDAFLTMCDKISEKDFVIMAANNALREINQERRK